MTDPVRFDGKAASSAHEAALTRTRGDKHEGSNCAREELKNEQVAVWAIKISDPLAHARRLIPFTVRVAQWVQCARIIFPTEKCPLLFAVPAANGSCHWLWPAHHDIEHMNLAMQSAPAMLSKVLKQACATSYTFWLKAKADSNDFLLVGGASVAGEKFLGRFDLDVNSQPDEMLRNYTSLVTNEKEYDVWRRRLMLLDLFDSDRADRPTDSVPQ